MSNVRKRINLRLPAEVVAWVKRQARLRRVSYTAVVEDALLSSMDSSTPTKAPAKRVGKGIDVHASDI